MVFCTEVYKGIYWVPLEEMNYLGGSDLSEDGCTPEKLEKFLIKNNYKAKNDNTIVEDNGKQWEIHCSGNVIRTADSVSCASLSSFVRVCLAELYDAGIFFFVSDTNRGHAMNYIIYEDWLYLFDMYARLKQFEKYIPKETGIRQDYVTSKYYTAACVKIKIQESEKSAFEKYAQIIRKRGRLKKNKYIFAVTSNKKIPDMCFHKREKIEVTFKDEVDLVLDYDTEVFSVIAGRE